jgi:hypothetical protein
MGISTPNVVANVLDAQLYECAICAMQKKLKLSSHGQDSSSNKYKQGYGGTYGVVWHSLHLVGLERKGGQFCVDLC